MFLRWTFLTFQSIFASLSSRVSQTIHTEILSNSIRAMAWPCSKNGQTSTCWLLLEALRCSKCRPINQHYLCLYAHCGLREATQQPSLSTASGTTEYVAVTDYVPSPRTAIATMNPRPIQQRIQSVAFLISWAILTNYGCCFRSLQRTCGQSSQFHTGNVDRGYVFVSITHNSRVSGG